MDILTVSTLVSHHARYRADALAVVCSGERLTWLQMEQRGNRLAHALLRAGVRHGDRVVTLLANCIELLEVYWACARVGAVAVPVSPLLMPAGLATLLADAEPRLIFLSVATRNAGVQASSALGGPPCCVLVGGDAQSDAGQACIPYAAFVDHDAADRIEVPVAPDDLCNIMYTSGTTGLPKGIALTHRIRAHYATLLANAWRMTPESVVLHTGALVFNGAFVTLMPALLIGCPYILHAQFDPAAFIEDVEREQVTHTMLVPSQITAILDSADFDASRLLSLQVMVSLGAPLPAAHKDRLESLLAGRLHELYGLTEGFITILDKRDTAHKRGSVGIPPPYFDLRIVDEAGQDVPTGAIGEIVGRGPLLMPGYYRRPDLTNQAIREGWLHTGDLGRVDNDGYLYLVDRKKDMIDSGGVKVYPRDIEEVIARHPEVAEAVVFGIPDDRWGETPVATVKLKPGIAAQDARAEALRDWINANVGAKYQRVSRVLFVTDFPRNAAGKILKRCLREPYWSGHDSAI